MLYKPLEFGTGSLLVKFSSTGFCWEIFHLYHKYEEQLGEKGRGGEGEKGEEKKSQRVLIRKGNMRRRMK